MNKEKEILMNYTIYDYLGLFFLMPFLDGFWKRQWRLFGKNTW